MRCYSSTFNNPIVQVHTKLIVSCISSYSNYKQDPFQSYQISCKQYQSHSPRVFNTSSFIPLYRNSKAEQKPENIPLKIKTENNHWKYSLHLTHSCCTALKMAISSSRSRRRRPNIQNQIPELLEKCPI